MTSDPKYAAGNPRPIYKPPVKGDPYEIMEEIFRLQAEFNQRVGMDHRNLDDAQLRAFIGKMLEAVYNECEELRNHTQWKWWKQYESEIDRHQVKIELIDIFHFFISMCLTVMTPREFIDLYLGKLRLNHKRQDVGYDENYQKVDEHGKEDNDYLKEPENNG